MPVTYDTPIKQRARTIELNFAKRYIDRPDSQSFLGLVGPEALEVERVTDRLDIPRTNIVALEHNKDNYEELCKRNNEEYDKQLDIQFSSAIKYLGKTEKTFEFISLDHDGKFARESKEELKQIFGRQILQKPGILHTAYYGSRENNDLNTFYFDPAKLVDSIMGGGEALGFYDKAFFQQEGMEKQKRSYGITLSIMHSAGLGKANIGPVEISKDFVVDLDSTDSVNKLATNLKFLKRQLGEHAQDAFYFLFSRAAKPYFVSDSQRFYYFSESTGMFGDVFKFDQHRDVFDWNRFDNVTMRRGELVQGSMPIKRTSPALMDMVKLMRGVSNKRRCYPLNRLHLGTDIRKELTEESAVQLLKNGFSEEHIYNNYKGWSVAHLKQLKGTISL